MPIRLRIFPIVISCCLMLLGAKGLALWAGLEMALSPAVQAQESSPREAVEPEEIDSSLSGQDAAGIADAVAETATEIETDVQPALVGDISMLSKSELEVLQNLAVRRRELEKRGDALKTRERLLQATEKRIDAKITELAQLEQNIKDMVNAYDEQEEAQLIGVVKMYEKMKAKDAARIFDQLELDLLVDVAERMKGSKMAPILASMSSGSAKRLTVELATRRTVEEQGG